MANHWDVTPQSIDVRFPIYGKFVPKQHCYELYSALSTIFPNLHEASWLGVHPIYGTPIDDALLIDEGSCVRVRVPVDKIAAVLPLAGRSLRLGEHVVVTGSPKLSMLRPSSRVGSYRVTVRGALTEAALYQSLVYRLTNLGIYRADLSLHPCSGIVIKGKNIICFRVNVGDLTAEDSLKIQAVGLGGRRRMGCGLFDPLGAR